MKNTYLLHRSGRNQFGDPGDSELPRYEPSPEQRALDEQLRVRHLELNDAFVVKHGETWRSLFSGLSKKDTWQKLYPRGGPALSTFRANSREFSTFEEFLNFLLLSNKRWSLSILGYSKSVIEEILSEFKECGRYYVSYGKSNRMFGSI